MLNERWHKRILRAKPSDITAPVIIEGISARIIDGENKMANLVRNHEKLMEYLQKDNDSGHAHNMDMLVASLNVNQHLREAVLDGEVTEDEANNMYVIRFPFGNKTIEYKLNKKAVDNG
jgi:hypothetical protein